MALLDLGSKFEGVMDAPAAPSGGGGSKEVGDVLSGDKMRQALPHLLRYSSPTIASLSTHKQKEQQPAAPKTFTLAYPSLQEALDPKWQWSSLAMRRAPVPRPFVMARRAYSRCAVLL